jgi:hypothetical protein
VPGHEFCLQTASPAVSSCAQCAEKAAKISLAIGKTRRNSSQIGQMSVSKPFSGVSYRLNGFAFLDHVIKSASS